jgi:hypothetical protein
MGGWVVAQSKLCAVCQEQKHREVERRRVRALVTPSDEDRLAFGFAMVEGDGERIWRGYRP